MIYIKVEWIHNLPNEPVELWSELDENRWEVRKIDIFRDGRMQLASSEFSTNDTKLGLIPTPEITRSISTKLILKSSGIKHLRQNKSSTRENKITDEVFDH